MLFEVIDLKSVTGGLQYCLIVWLLVLGLLVIRKVVLTRRSMHGLLSTQGTGVDPERVMLLMFTIGFAMFYSIDAINTPLEELSRGKNGPSMPDVAPQVLVALFGAQSSYLLGKLLRSFEWGKR